MWQYVALVVIGVPLLVIGAVKIYFHFWGERL